jgi:hypothetical protein
MFDQLFLHCQGGVSLGGYQTNSFTHPKNMRVNCHIGLLINYTGDHIGGFSSYAGQLNQLCNR